MKFSPATIGITTSTLLLCTVLAGCSQAPQIQATPAAQGDNYQLAVTAAFEGDLAYVQSCVQSDPRYLQAYDDQGRTLLHYAAEGGHADVVAYLLEQGAYANVEDNDGYYPLDAASQGAGSREVMDLIRAAIAREAGR